MSKPDWKKASYTHGGRLADIPKPHVRMFPHKGLKRRVDVRIDSFVGVVAYARHWRPSFDEEENPIWNAEKETWQKAHDDVEGYGSHIRGPAFTSEKDAREWVQWMLRAFDPKKYEFQYGNDLAYSKRAKPKWFYAHEGD